MTARTRPHARAHKVANTWRTPWAAAPAAARPGRLPARAAAPPTPMGFPDESVPPVEFEELEGYPTYGVSLTEITARRRLRFDWADIDAAVAMLSPYTGNEWATFPGRPLMWVHKIDIEPELGVAHDGGLTCTYDKAIFTVDYHVPKWDGGPATGTGGGGSGAGTDNSPRQGQSPQADTETLLSHRVSVGAEWLILPSSGLVWGNGWDATAQEYDTDGVRAVTSEINAGILIPIFEHQITWHRVAAPPWSAIRASIGCVNDDGFAGAAAGTLLFLGVEASVEYNNEGLNFWKMDYKFSEKNLRSSDPDDLMDRGWNYFYRKETGQFEYLARRKPTAPVAAVRAGGGGPVPQAADDVMAVGRPIYAFADFEELFQPAD